MPEYLLHFGDLPPAYVSARDDPGAIEMAWATILEDQRDGVEGRALPAMLTGPDGRVLVEVTVADVETRRAR